MAFDMGFDFRGTAGYVTDPSYAVPVLVEVYPHTYTNVDGKSINAGWNPGANMADRVNTNDPRIAGINYGDATTRTFVIDLSSGSAPGAGTYTIDMAIGDAGGSNTCEVTVKDNATALITLADTVVAAGHYIDATLTDVTASTTWTGTTVSKTFASTTCNVVTNPSATAKFTTLAHFRLTLQAAGGTVATRSMLMLVGVGA